MHWILWWQWWFTGTHKCNMELLLFFILKLLSQHQVTPHIWLCSVITVLVLVANSVETLAWNVHYWSPWNQLEIHAWHHPPILSKQGILWAWLFKKKKKIPLYSIYCSWIILLRSWEIWCNYRLTPCDGWEVCYSTCLCYFGTGSFVASGAKRSFNQSNIIKVDKLMIILVIDYLTIFFMVNQFVHKMSNISGFQLLLSSNHQSQTQWKVNSYI